MGKNTPESTDFHGARELDALATGAHEDLPQDVAGWLNGEQDRAAAIAASMKITAVRRMANEKSPMESR